MESYKTTSFRFKDGNGGFYDLRKDLITSCWVRYRVKGSPNYLETHEYNIDEYNDRLWVRLPADNQLYEIVIHINVGPMRTICTPLSEIQLGSRVDFDMDATPAPLQSLQGYSPRVIEGWWCEYDDEGQAFMRVYEINQNVITGTIETTDYAVEGDKRPMTSTGVWSALTEVNQQITNVNNRVDNHETRITDLEGKNYGVLLNNEEHWADGNGLIDLGEIKEGGNEEIMVTTNTKTMSDGTLIPRGSTYDKDDKIVSLSSPYEYYNRVGFDAVDGWMYVCVINGSMQINARIDVYMNNFQGELYIERRGYDYYGVTTSPYLAGYLAIYQRGLSAYLVIKGATHYAPRLQLIIKSGTYYPVNGPVSNFNINNLRNIDVFMTSYEESADYIDITANTYETTFADMGVFNYNTLVSGDVNFSMTDEVTAPFTLRFTAFEDNTKIHVTDSTGTWTAESQTINVGDVAFLTWSSDDTYSWTYTTRKEYEVITNKVNTIDPNHTGKTIHYTTEQSVINYVSDKIGSGVVKTVTLNGETHTPDSDGDVDLGSISSATEFDVQLYLRNYTINGYYAEDEQKYYDTIQIEDANGAIVDLKDLFNSVAMYNPERNSLRYVLWADDHRSTHSGTRYNRWCGYVLRGWQGGRLVWDCLFSTTNGLVSQDDFNEDVTKLARIEFVPQDGDAYTANAHWFVKEIGGNGDTDIEGVILNENVYTPEDGWINLGSIDDCEPWDVVINLDNLDGYGTMAKPLHVSMGKQRSAALGSAPEDRLKVLIKGATSSNFVQLYVDIDYAYELTSIQNTPMMLVNQSSSSAVQLLFKVNGIGNTSGNYLGGNNLNHNRIWLAMIYGNPQAGYTFAPITEVGEVDAWLNAYSTAVYNSSTNKLELTRLDGSKTNLTIGGGGGSSLSSVTLNGSAHTASNNAIDLGTIKVKTGNDTFSADTDNTIDVGVFSRPTNCRLNTSKSGWVKIDGNNSWFDVTIRLYDAEARILSYQQSGGIRVAYSDSGNRIAIFTDKTNSQCFYLYYGGNTSYFLKVNQGNVKITDTEGVTHTIHEYDDVTNNTYNVQLETIDNVTNTLFQLVGHTNPASTNVGTFDWTLPQSTMDYFGKYSMSNSGDVTMTLPLPTMRSNSFDRLCMFENKSSRSPITATIKDNNGNIIKQLTVQPNSTTTTLVEWIGNYSESTSYSGWKCESSTLPDEPNIILGAASQWICTFDLPNTEVIFERDGRSVTIISDSANTTYIKSVSDNNDYLTVLLSDSAPSTCMVSCNGGLTMTVKKGKVTFDEAYGKVITVDPKMHYNSVVFPFAETNVGSYQAMCGNSYYVNGSQHLPNATRYNRSGGNLTSINVYLNPPTCTRQKLTTYHTLYTSSSASSWTAFLYGKKSDGSFYQISRQHSYDSAYGKEVVYPTTWDVELQKWVLGEQ